MTPSPGQTVLIVDDDQTQLKLYSWILQRGGFRPLTALVGTSDVDLPHAQPVDLITLDYRLSSQLTAVDVANRLRDTFPAVPILVLSEMAWMPDDIAPYASAFVSKGDPENLLKVIGSLMSGHAIAPPQ